MLRILSSKIFREDLDEYALPMFAFEKFEDIVNKVDFTNGTYKFCLPVSIGDFSETNVPACFSNNMDEIKAFVELQSKLNNRKAFIISDFLVWALSNVCFSGVISTYSQVGIYDSLDKSTTISLTLKNPILTYGREGVSPRDLPADIQLTYDRVCNPFFAFPQIDIKKDNIDFEKYKGVIYQAYMASIKIHETSELYDGKEYREHTLFFVDNKYRVWLYEIIGEESFLGRAKKNIDVIKDELNYIKFLPLSVSDDHILSSKCSEEKIKSLCKKLN